jgi:hypothetical protein
MIILGVMEYWSDGVMVKKMDRVFQYLPILQYSITPGVDIWELNIAEHTQSH